MSPADPAGPRRRPRFTTNSVRANGHSEYDDRLAEIVQSDVMAQVRAEQAALDKLRKREPEPAPPVREVGDHVLILGHADGDPYIFSFQRSGRIARRLPDGQYMLTLDSAVGEWGPIPGERLGRWR